MTKKDIQQFDKLVQKTFKKDVNTFQEIVKIYINIMVQENKLANDELMEKVDKYCNENQMESYFTNYFKFSEKIIMELDSLELIESEDEYKKIFDNLVKNILNVLPKIVWKHNVYGAMGDLIDVINNEYNIGSYPVDDNFFKTLEKIFMGITPMAQLYMIMHEILNNDTEPNITKATDDLFEDAKVLFSFIVFSNILRKQILHETQITPTNNQLSKKPANSVNYGSKDNQIYQLKISIKGAKPPIWRRILVESDISFYELHNIIQNIFNWQDYHLYQFDGYKSYTDAESLEDDMGYGEDLNDATEYPITSELQNEKDKVSYTYDFGDDWTHEILLEKVLVKDTKKTYPICTAGRRNGPLEDSSGIWGYSEIVYVIETNDFSNAEHLKDEDGNFYYEGFDPSYFNKDEVNAKLNHFC